MALNANQMAEDMKIALGFVTEPTSEENKNMAADIIAHLQTGVVSHAPGTVTGIAPPSGGPLINGAASNGIIVLVPADLVARFVATFKISTPEIIGMATAISTHLITGLVSFSTGSITGICSNTAVNPGTLIGEGVGGTINGLDGAAMASLMANLMGKPGTTPELESMTGAIVSHIQNNAEVTYLTGSVTGTASAGGGPIIAGTAVSGSIA